jgi:hypothetical protein
MKGNGWNDSGHNFLVTRGGFILEGRHGTVAAIKAGRMVVSAHCPGQNDQPGIEHEHIGTEAMTPIQREASVWLHAWICRHCTIPPSHIYPHKQFFATSCPGVLNNALPKLRLDVAAALKPSKPEPVKQPYRVHIVNKDMSEDTFQADAKYLDKLWERFRKEKQFHSFTASHNR